MAAVSPARAAGFAGSSARGPVPGDHRRNRRGHARTHSGGPDRPCRGSRVTECDPSLRVQGRLRTGIDRDPTAVPHSAGHPRPQSTPATRSDRRRPQGRRDSDCRGVGGTPPWPEKCEHERRRRISDRRRAPGRGGGDHDRRARAGIRLCRNRDGLRPRQTRAAGRLLADRRRSDHRQGRRRSRQGRCGLS